MQTKPRIAVLVGDPCGVGPEITAKVLADPSAAGQAQIIIIADRGQFLAGQQVAKTDIPFMEASSVEQADFSQGLPVLLHHEAGAGCVFNHGELNIASGRYCMETMLAALDLASRGLCDAICFAPLNKEAMHKAGMNHSDELGWIAERIDFTGPVCHINVLNELWTSRVTSHISIKDVSAQITKQNVLNSVLLIEEALKRAGKAQPKVAVAALNPHGGEGGLFGHEETEQIIPAVEEARSLGLKVEGPFPADTLFLKALNGEYDAVVTMYHDQGQIAMKLTGFDRGVTLQGGLPIPITTPAHGTAFDIAGKGVANDSAMRLAFELAIKMGANRLQNG
jgi:4-hydroxythreonine-4-phosphate dehydrogenase